MNTYVAKVNDVKNVLKKTVKKYNININCDKYLLL